MKVKYNLSLANKSLWEDLGWDLRASSQPGISTSDFTDVFVDDNYNNLIHSSGLSLMENKNHDLKSLYDSLSFEIDEEQLILIHEMFKKGLFFATECDNTAASGK
jgi:hypothetical protein